jgi:hypothetical protein
MDALTTISISLLLLAPLVTFLVIGVLLLLGLKISGDR